MVPESALLGPEWYQQLARDWLRALARRRRAASTMSTYTTPLRHLGRWLEMEGIAEPHLLDRQVLDHWQDVLVHGLSLWDQVLIPPVSARTHSTYAGAIRGLLRWGAREGVLRPGLADWIESPQVPETDPHVLERDQLNAVLDRYREPLGDLRYLRDRALFWFLVTSSARITEALRLDLRQLDRRRWVVVQKGGSEKAIVISTMARAWLEQYLRVRGRDSEPALWIYEGPLAGRRRLTREDTNEIWKRLCRELGIAKFTNRWLRGTSATELDEAKNTAIDIAHHLGHRNLKTILRYTMLREPKRQAMVDGLDQLLPPPPAPTPVGRGRPRPRPRRRP